MILRRGLLVYIEREDIAGFSTWKIVDRMHGNHVVDVRETRY